MHKIKIGLIGLGHLGALHLKTYKEIADQVELVGLCDIKRKETQDLAKEAGLPFIENYKDFVGKVDAVDICVPTKSHFDIAKFFLTSSIHTFIEKPITTTVEQADELIALAEKNKLTIQVGHVERFNAAFESIKHFTRNPLFIECHRLNFFPKRSLDIGVVLDLMIHDIDIILGIIPSKIQNIQAVGAKVLTSKEDIANVRLTFENGCVCNLTASRISDEVVRKIRIFQKNTYISLDYVKQEAFIYKKHLLQILKHNLPIEREQPLKKELSHFAECLRENKKPIVTGIEGRQALKVALEITQIIFDNLKRFNL